jgi:hypothetical protein
VSRGFIEVMIALFLTFKYRSDSYAFWWCSFIYILAAIRSVFNEQFDLPALIFILAYGFQNLITNIVDLAVFKQSLEFKEDVDFEEMFSFKLFQTLLCLIVAFVYS